MSITYASQLERPSLFLLFHFVALCFRQSGAEWMDVGER